MNRQITAKQCKMSLFIKNKMKCEKYYNFNDFQTANAIKKVFILLLYLLLLMAHKVNHEKRTDGLVEGEMGGRREVHCE